MVLEEVAQHAGCEAAATMQQASALRPEHLWSAFILPLGRTLYRPTPRQNAFIATIVAAECLPCR